MKLFQKLLLAPAALGLLAPVAANAADVNIAGLSQYAADEQVTSITQFSDVQPTDWAYQALSNLIERYGCVAGYPNGTYRGNRAMTRYEAAALLNACLDRITEVTDELKRLMKEFERELAVLRGRVDGLEARVGELEATQFSTTTKLKGVATFVVGGVNYGGTGSNKNSRYTGKIFSANPLGANSYTEVKGSGVQNTSDYNSANYGATTFNYDLKLFFDTSFTGKDLLRTMLRAGNFGTSAFANGLTTLETGFQDPRGADVVGVNRLFYNFPVGDDLSVTVGAKVRVDDVGMLGIWPSVYPADTVLDAFTYAGAAGAYNLNGLGGGFGAVYNNVLGVDGLTISGNYVASDAQDGNPSTGGLMTEGSASASVFQAGYTGSDTPWIGGSYGVAFAYTYAQNLAIPTATPYAAYLSGLAGTSNSYGLSGYWVPDSVGLIPSVSWGFGNTRIFQTTYNRDTYNANSWMVGLQWPDTFVKGNDLGMAVGAAPRITNIGSNKAGSFRARQAANGYADGAFDNNLMWEWWYKFQVSDNITVTPAIFYIDNVDGQAGRKNIKKGNGAQDGVSNAFGALLKTTFKF